MLIRYTYAVYGKEPNIPKYPVKKFYFYHFTHGT